MRGVTYRSGVTTASLSAGALFAIGMVVAAMHVETLADLEKAIGLAIAASLFATPFGFVLAIVPIWLGAAVFASIGRGNIAMRLPVVWALGGAGAGAMIGYIATGTDPYAQGDGAWLMAAVGAGCALVCRRFTVWQA